MTLFLEILAILGIGAIAAAFYINAYFKEFAKTIDESHDK